ncbi:MAG: UDP-3-O-acyl-N-acetylglucosamine deacetylase [Bacillota bacterium]
MRQKTISREVFIKGQALHTGVDVEMRCAPASGDAGIVFFRSDLPGSPAIPAMVSQVSDTRKCTAIGKGDAQIQTIEHFMAALAALHLDNLHIYVHGPEIPLGDGSAGVFARRLLEAGIEEQRAERKVAVLDEPVWAFQPLPSGKLASIVALPAETPMYSYTFVSEHDALSDQYAEYSLDSGNFLAEIADARTIAFMKEIEFLRKQGRALGGNMDIAVVVGEQGLLNPMRLPQEVARHKLVDLIGDLYLLGPVRARFIGIRSGHSLNNALACKLAGILR